MGTTLKATYDTKAHTRLRKAKAALRQLEHTTQEALDKGETPKRAHRILREIPTDA